MIKLKLNSKIYPTENPDKIINMFKYFYDFSNIEISEPNHEGVQLISAVAEGPDALNFLFEQIRNQRTVEAVRNQVLARIDLNHQDVSFLIHKQVLMKKKIALVKYPEESPLGPVKITIEANNIESTIEYLFPPTKGGVVLEVDYQIEK